MGVVMWEQLFDRMLKVMFRQGDLTVVFPSGRRARYGDDTGQPAEVTIHTEAAMRAQIARADAA